MDTASPNYFTCWVRFNQTDIYLIWYSSSDGKYDCRVLLDEKNCIRTFADAPSLRHFADKNKIVLELEEPILHNFDVVKSWLQNPKRCRVKHEFLGVWNLCDDIAYSVNDQQFTEYIDRYKRLWSDLLWSCRPIRHKRDVRVLRRVLARGIELFRNHLAPQSKEN